MRSRKKIKKTDPFKVAGFKRFLSKKIRLKLMKSEHRQLFEEK